VKGNNVFDDSLLGTTIQDGSKRERSNVVTTAYHYIPCNKLLIFFKKSLY